MPKKHRLSRADLVALPRSKARRVHGNYFTLTVTPLPAGKVSKIATVVSKKIAAHAVDRNKIERRCREVLQPLIPRVKEPLAFVFHAKREVVGASFQEIARDIKALMVRVQST